MKPNKQDPKTLLRPWHKEALRAVKNNPQGATPATIWRQIQGKTKPSKASVISLLNRLAQENILEKQEETYKAPNGPPPA